MASPQAREFRTKPLVRALLILASLAATAVVAASAFGGDGRPPTALADLPQFDDVAFITVCRFSHFKPDDPIVLPRFPGFSHDHSFFGNRSTNAFSTLSTLHRGATTCQRPEDTASYWAPTLLVDGKPVAPDEAEIYYRRSTLAHVRAFPPGLKGRRGRFKSVEAAEPAHRLLELLLGDHRRLGAHPHLPDAEPARARPLPELLGRPQRR